MRPNYPTLIDWLLIHTDSIKDDLVIALEDAYGFEADYNFTESKGNWLKFTIDPKRPTIMAHLDTVTRTGDAPVISDIVSTTTYDILGSPTTTLSLSSSADPKIKCLGGDDRAGVYAVVEVIRNLPTEQKPNVIFTYDEEIGRLGAKQFIKDHPDFTTPFIFEFDRAKNDIVFYETGNEDFQKFVSNIYDMPIGRGSFSDITQFQTELNINSANIGIGYKAQHTRNETINTNMVAATIERTIAIFKNENVIRRLSGYEWKDVVVQSWDSNAYGYGPYQATTTGWNLGMTGSSTKSSTVTNVKPIVKPKPVSRFSDILKNINELDIEFEVNILDEAVKTKGKWFSLQNYKNIKPWSVTIYKDITDKIITKYTTSEGKVVHKSEIYLQEDISVHEAKKVDTLVGQIQHLIKCNTLKFFGNYVTKQEEGKSVAANAKLN